MNKIDLLFTSDENYAPHMLVALLSIKLNNPDNDFKVWLIHESISDRTLAQIQKITDQLGFEFVAVKVDGSQWQGAPTVERYPKEMYFRLLAGEILPSDLHKVLYLDPDVLVINPLAELWETDIENYVFAAASHIALIDVSTPVNKLRLNMDNSYFNSGIMLINLDQARAKIRWNDINDTIKKYADFLLLPDQDILNTLYGKYTLEIPEIKWNYDARMYARYLTKSLGKYNIHAVMQDTAILHFAGQPKPWQPNHDNRFTALYLTYQNMIEKMK